MTASRVRAALVLSLLPALVTLPALAAPPGPAPGPASVSGTVASAAGKVVYRQPTSYAGVTKPPKTKPAPVSVATLSTTGDRPDVYVDEAGTAHIVWNETRGGDADATVYCRLKRAATACATTTALLWDKTYGPGDGPGLNNDFSGPEIVRVGDQLVVLSQRFPTGTTLPDGSTSGDNVVAWVSNDGGATWSGGTPVGRGALGQVVVTGSETNPLMVNINPDSLCGGVCVEGYRSATYDGTQGHLDPAPDTTYGNASLAPDGGTLLASIGDIGIDNARMWLRRWNGTGPVTDPASWSLSPPLTALEGELAGGPSGAFVLYRNVAAGGASPLRVRRVNADLSWGAATTVGAQGGAQAQLDEDPSGRLRAVWLEGSTVRMSTSGTTGSGFDKPTTILGGAANGQISLAATGDGGGYVVLQHVAEGGQPPAITAVAVGSLAPTGKPGLAGVPGGGNISCSTIDFGAFDLRAESGCFVTGTGANKHVVVTSGAVMLNGLELVPTPGATLVIDAKDLQIDSIGAVRVLLRDGAAEVELFRGVLHRDLKSVKPGTSLFEFPHELYQASVLGFPVSAGIAVQLTNTGVRVPVSLRLPPELGGFTGDAVLVGSTGEGLRLASLRVRMGPIPLGVAVLDHVALDWKEGGTWSGDGSLTLPAGGTIEARIEFVSGDFASASFNYAPNPPIAVGPYVYLTSVGGGLAVRPDVEIKASATLGAGAPVQGAQPVTATGTFTMRFPHGGPASFRLDGQVDLLAVRIAQGYFQFLTSGNVRLRGDASLSLGPISGSVVLDGFVDASGGQYGVQASAGSSYCATVRDPAGKVPDSSECGGAQLAMSSIGIAACATIDPPVLPSFSAGLATRWDDLEPGALVNPALLVSQVIKAIAVPCSTSAYAIPPPATGPAARAIRSRGGAAFTVPRRLPSATFLVPGVGGVPDVVVTGPSGAVLAGPGASGKGVHVLGFPGADTLFVVVDEPRHGGYTVEAAPGSVPLGQVLLSRGFVTAKVTGKVARGRITYATRHLGKGQSLVFRESGRFGTNLMGPVRDKKGTFRFHPAVGPGGKRRVDALVMYDGLVKRVVRLGSYLAPGPTRAGRVHRVRVRHAGSVVRVRFRPARHAARTEVVVRGDAGNRVARMVVGKRGRVTVRGFLWDSRLTVTIRTWSADGRPGKTVRVRVRD